MNNLATSDSGERDIRTVLDDFLLSRFSVGLRQAAEQVIVQSTFYTWSNYQYPFSQEELNRLVSLVINYISAPEADTELEFSVLRPPIGKHTTGKAFAEWYSGDFLYEAWERFMTSLSVQSAASFVVAIAFKYRLCNDSELFFDCTSILSLCKGLHHMATQTSDASWDTQAILGELEAILSSCTL